MNNYVENQIPNLGAMGSNPVGCTNDFNGLTQCLEASVCEKFARGNI
jgi:hypothetical protein